MDKIFLIILIMDKIFLFGYALQRRGWKRQSSAKVSHCSSSVCCLFCANICIHVKYKS